MPVTVMRDGPEAIEDAIASTLRANVNAYLDAVWAAWGDAASVPKVYPAQIVSGRRALQPQFPAYIVRSLDGHTQEDLAPRYGYMAHRFEIVVLCQSSDDHVLDVQIKRHLTAIRKTLGNAPTLDGSIGGILGITLESYGKSPSHPNDRKLMEQTAAWIATVRVEESYS